LRVKSFKENHNHKGFFSREFNLGPLSHQWHSPLSIYEEIQNSKNTLCNNFLSMGAGIPSSRGQAEETKDGGDASDIWRFFI